VASSALLELQAAQVASSALLELQAAQVASSSLLVQAASAWEDEREVECPILEWHWWAA
jgi:hypothetical protein